MGNRQTPRMRRILLIGLLIFLPQVAFAGSQTFTSSGTFTVPAYGTLTVEVWGGGGGGGAVAPVGWVNVQSTPGGQSSFSTVEAGGGGGGISEYVTGQLPGVTTAQGGVASGGDINLPGGISPPAPSYPSHYSSAAGSAPYGGAGGAGGDPDYWCPAHIPGVLDVNGRPGTFPGGGGGGAETIFGGIGGGAGAGAYAKKTYAPNQLVTGTTVPVTVGAGGTGGHHGTTGWCIGNWGYWYWDGGAGAPGKVTITWTDPPPPLSCNGTAETFSTQGTYTRTVPTYSLMIVEVWGGGGGGGDSILRNGSAGGSSTFSAMTAGGGDGGLGGQNGAGGGRQGSASGGDTNTSGTAGGTGTFSVSGSGGSAPNGGSGGAGGTSSAGANGNTPGGGGAGSYSHTPGGGGGGAGAYAKKTYASGALTVGSSVTLGVGSGGAGGTQYGWSGGAGANGQVQVICSTNSVPTTPVITGPTSGFTKTNYAYTFRSTDPDSDTIRYGIDWDGNGSIDEYVPALGYVPSGTTSSTSHSWNSSNTQTFKALAQDSKGATSGWASYTVNMSPNAPTVLLTAVPSSITNGQSSTLTWSSTNANSCTGTNFSTGGATQNTSPGVSVSPTVTTTYTVTCTGAGNQTASDSKTVTVTCTATNICSGTNVVNSCTGAIVQSCSYQCGAGACIPPPAPVPNPTGTGPTALSGHLQVRPSLVVMGDRTRVFWNFSNVTSCTASRDNPPPESWTVAGTLANGWTSSSGSAGMQSGPIVERTTFRLVCTPFVGQTFAPETAVVNVVPVFEEQ